MGPFHLRLVRHAETDANDKRILESHTPTPLNSLGRRQAAALAAALKKEGAKFSRIFSSDTTRPLETCHTALPDKVAEVRLDKRLRERDSGALNGLGYEEASKRQMEAKEKGKEIEGLETPAQVQKRGAEFYKDIVAEMGGVGGEAVVFSHAGWILIMLKYLQQERGLDLQSFLPDGAPLHFCWNTGQTRLLIQPDGSATCEYLYNDDHLTGDLAPNDDLQVDGTKRPRNSKATAPKGNLMG